MVRPLRRKEKSPARGSVGPTTSYTRELRALCGTPCLNVEKRCEVLRRRDELLSKHRLETAADSQSAGEAPQVLSGNCPDMCPEKERYVREMQQNLNAYECDRDGRIVHSKVVKDYSRSAADQEMPLPHELRPPHVLLTTMDYLLDNIASAMPTTSEDAIVAWYDFLWSRTRAIRKDITQQMLSNSIAIDLVERCVRLHIFAAFNLAQLRSAGFDQTMNTENLQKSLQTLRHMYSDVQEESCSNEAEFRSYDILNHLKDPNVYSQAVTYRSSIRSSDEVVLALSLATALQNNDYVRFFRQLKRHGSYLQCCLCYRYFTAVRCKAFRAIAQAYRMFPLEKFTELLGFDSDKASLHFIALMGAKLDVDSSDFISFYPRNPTWFTPARENVIEEEAVPDCRWLKEKARGQSIPEILSKRTKPRQPAPPKPVVDSFDEAGRYVNDPVVRDFLRGDNLNEEAQQSSRDEITEALPTTPSPFLPRATAALGRGEELLKKPSPESTSTAEWITSVSVHTPLFPTSLSTKQSPDMPSDSSSGPPLPIQLPPSTSFKSSAFSFLPPPQQLDQQGQPGGSSPEQSEEESTRIVAAAEAETEAQQKFEEEQAAQRERREAEERARQERQAAELKERHAREERERRMRREEQARLAEERQAFVAKELEHTRTLQQLDNIRDNLYSQWLRQFSDHWLRVVKQRRWVREQLENVSLMLAPAHPTKPTTPSREIDLRRFQERGNFHCYGDERAELRRLLIIFKTARRRHIGQLYFARWRQRVERRQWKHYIDGFFETQSPTTRGLTSSDCSSAWGRLETKGMRRKRTHDEDGGYFVFNSDLDAPAPVKREHCQLDHNIKVPPTSKSERIILRCSRMDYEEAWLSGSCL